ncbi:Tetratricopeptide repeat-containing protein [Micromonospora chaiyaphumensis]|uniref:Tetratricopeptide repeat-containing protein n=2 Tax=Micromonospora chaiyaphumensis TaxID=307119 RepID=A0A1C4W764_9ACTN|nr:Tetratricopeptide repeat-containing protein [Micromonospora chaiyaphumensis]
MGGAALATLAGYAPIDLLEALTEQLPPGRYVSLDLATAAVVRRVVTHRLTQITDPAERGRLYLDLSGRLGYAGLHREALETAQAAVTAFEEADGIERGTHLPGLASALTNLGFRLSDLGDSTAALAASTRAAAIAEELTRVNPKYSGHHAVALNNLSVDLANEHRWDEARDAAQRAVTINRALNAGEPSRLQQRPELAMSLDNLANALRNLGRLREALAAHREAVKVCDQLAAEQPETHEHDLALYLNNLGLTLRDLGELAEALVHIERATEIRRRLARHNPSAHSQGLLRSIRAQVKITARLGRRDEAFALLDDYRELLHTPATGTHNESEPPIDELGKVRELQLRGLIESQLGLREAAVQTYQTLSLILATLADREPVTYRAMLGTTLTELSLALSNVDRHEDALKASEATVRLYRELDAEIPNRYRAELAVALDNLSTDLDRLGKNAEADPIQDEAIRILRALPSRGRGAQLRALAHALHNGAMRLLSEGLFDQAIPLLTESVSIRDELGAESVGRHLSRLVKSLSGLAFALSQLGSAEAAAVARRTVEAYRRLGPELRAEPDYQLAVALEWSTVALRAAGDHEAALKAVQERIVLATRFMSHSYLFAIQLPLAHLEAAVVLTSLGREPEAIEADGQAVLSSVTRLTPSEPSASSAEQKSQRIDEQRLAKLFNERGYRAREAGRTEAALDLLCRSIPFARRVEDVVCERLARENVYLALREAQRYPESLAALLGLAEFFAREAQPSPSDLTDTVPESVDASPNERADLVRYASRYRQEVIETDQALTELSEPLIVRDWMVEVDVNQWVKKYGEAQVQDRRILLVERHQDVVEVLGHASPERRREFVQAFLATLAQRPES